MIFEKTINELRRLNKLVAIATGGPLALTIVYILTDVVLRQIDQSFGGTDEISGYVVAIVASWGLTYALLELAHVRIDVLRFRLGSKGRTALDLLSILIMTLTAVVIAAQSWNVLEKSISRNAKANTPLETPLWIPQALWFSGWAWFALTCTLLTICAVGLLIRRRLDCLERTFGTDSELEILK